MLDQLGNGILLGAIIAITSLGLSLVFSVTKTLNFAHGDMVTVGGVLTVFLSSNAVGLPLWLSAIAAVLFGAFLGFVLDLALFRPMRHKGVGGVTMLVTTIGLALIVRYVLLAFFGPQPGSLALPSQTVTSYFGLQLTPVSLYVIIVSLVILVLVALFLRRSTMGISMRAISSNRDLASASGVNVDRLTLVTWAFGGGLAAVGGVMLAFTQLVYWDMGTQLLLLMFAGIIVGGVGNPFGAMAGGFLVGVVTQLSVALPFVREHTDLKLVISLAIITLVLLARPQGLLTRKERIS